MHHEDIITDKLRLNQVLLNIVATLSSLHRQAVPSISALKKSRLPAGYATFVFSVKDNGIGINRRTLRRTF